MVKGKLNQPQRYDRAQKPRVQKDFPEKVKLRPCECDKNRRDTRYQKNSYKYLVRGGPVVKVRKESKPENQRIQQQDSLANHRQDVVLEHHGECARENAQAEKNVEERLILVFVACRKHAEETNADAC